MAKAILASRIPEIIAELPLVIDKAAEAGAELVAADAKTKVNRGPDPYHIADDIHVEREDEGEYSVVAGNPEHTYYGHILEHGSVKMSPRPFLVPALEEKTPEVIAGVVATLEKL